jgi:hypothetical protein
MILSVASRIPVTGAYSELFWGTGKKTVLKQFISGRHESNTSQGLTTPSDDIRRFRTFVWECDAYEVAIRDPRLQLHVPRFYGRQKINDVVDENGTSIARFYLLDCCYELEYVEGKL